MAFTIYKNTDDSAPTLTGLSSSLLGVLDACLVNGYGSKSPAGWSVEYTSSNVFGTTVVSAYRMPSGSKCYMRVNDSSSLTQEAYIRGYRTMTDINTGTEGFPGINSGTTVGTYEYILKKSDTTSGLARDWVIAADDRTFYMFTKPGVAVGTLGAYNIFAFGDFYSLSKGDSYNVMILGRYGAGQVGIFTGVDYGDRVAYASQSGAGINSGHSLINSYTGLGGATPFTKFGNFAFAGSISSLAGNITFPNPSDGGLFLSPIWISDPLSSGLTNIRGRFRGLWHYCHALNTITDGDIITGTGDFVGRQFLVIKTTSPYLASVWVVEISDTLETNTY